MSSFNIKPKTDTATNFIVGKLFSAVTQLHIFHLQVTPPNSFAAHMALGGLYSALPDKIDALVETIQGKTETIITGYVIDQPKDFVNIPTIISLLRMLKGQVETYRTSLIAKSWANIDNQLQTVVDDIESCIYKLKFLQ